MGKNSTKSRTARNRRIYVFTRDNFTCHYCKTKFPAIVPTTPQYYSVHGNHLTVDHITPKSLGGMNTRDNLVTACHECNNARGDMGYKAFVRLMKRKMETNSLSIDYTILTAEEREEREKIRKARCEIKFSH